MIKNLPEGSNYVSALMVSAPREEPETVEVDPFQDQKFWTQDRLLQAQLINSVNMLVRFSIHWQDGQAPDLPVVGPAAWRGEGPNSTPSKPLTVMDVINRVTGQNG